MSSISGTTFRIATFGESHGPGVGVVIDGCPPNIELDLAAIQHELTRRRPGQSRLTTQRKEADEFEVLSGMYAGRTLGTSLALLVRNSDVKSTDYLKWADTYRPSHADYTYDAKYGFRTPIGGGRASVRETIGRVAAGAIARQILQQDLGMQTVAYVSSIGQIDSDVHENPPATRSAVDESLVRCPDPSATERMVQAIDAARKAGDSIGGVIGVTVHNPPPGLGDPVFAKLEAELAAACLSIPACKGFESGSGFAGTRLTGSAHNDAFVPGEPGKTIAPDRDVRHAPRPSTPTNRSGGIQGGISNGMPITMRLAFKPTATIHQDQQTVNEAGQPVTLKAGGRHDPCVLPRAVPIVEAVVDLVLVDAYLRQRAQNPLWWLRFVHERQAIASRSS